MKKNFGVFFIFLFLLCGSFNIQASIVPNPKERVEYWRKNFRELTPNEDARVWQAQQIFERVLNAAGSRHGVHPRLHILAEDPLNISLPVSIPDGWVILSKKVLDLCYQEPNLGDDRLAFVMAHEIAHLLDDDFWHINFFNAIDMSKRKGLGDEFILNQIRGIIGETDKVRAKELRADEKGILFASMAGFNVNAIVDQNANDGFFAQWESLLNPKRLKRLKVHNDHPTSVQRNTAILSRLQQVSDQAEMFKLGLLFYQTGDFEKAIEAFGEFQRHYPGREVHHNLAISYHQLALKLLGTTNRSKAAEFKLTLSIDPITRASTVTNRGPEENYQRFKELIHIATDYYQTAIKQDSSYLLAYKNLGSAYIINNEPFKAIAILKDALKLAPDDPALLNIIGVAFHFSENSLKAQYYLERAAHKAPNFSDPLYNLGIIAYQSNKMLDAKSYWNSYMQLDPGSNWSKTLRSRYKVGETIARARGLLTVQNEMIAGIQIGNYSDEVPRVWGEPSSKELAFKDLPLMASQYKNGITTISEGDEIRAIRANKQFIGETNRGIKIGASKENLLSAYGVPSVRLDTTLGTSWVYKRERITFQIRNNNVVSWVVF